MPTTTSHSLPYPDSTDPADVPADLAALAEALDSSLDAIAPSQITGPTAGQILIANASGVVTGTTVTGDVSITSTGNVQIGSGAVGSAEIASSAVTTAKIDTDAVTADKQPDGLYPPTGAILQYAGASAPAGWLLCDGTAIDRTTYAALFAAIGTSYGAGNGSTTFNVPDLRGRVPVGKGTHSDVDALGDADARTLADRRPAHGHAGTAATGGAHTHSGTTSSNGDHYHLSDIGTGSLATNFVRTGNSNGITSVNVQNDVAVTSTAGAHTHTFSIASSGSHSHSVTVGSDTTNAPAYVVVNYLIRI